VVADSAGLTKSQVDAFVADDVGIFIYYFRDYQSCVSGNITFSAYLPALYAPFSFYYLAKDEAGNISMTSKQFQVTAKPMITGSLEVAWSGDYINSLTSIPTVHTTDMTSNVCKVVASTNGSLTESQVDAATGGEGDITTASPYGDCSNTGMQDTPAPAGTTMYIYFIAKNEQNDMAMISIDRTF
jgi:hypothetical protein